MHKKHPSHVARLLDSYNDIYTLVSNIMLQGAATLPCGYHFFLYSTRLFFPSSSIPTGPVTVEIRTLQPEIILQFSYMKNIYLNQSLTKLIKESFPFHLRLDCMHLLCSSSALTLYKDPSSALLHSFCHLSSTPKGSITVEITNLL